jgi:hypothetical protein
MRTKQNVRMASRLTRQERTVKNAQAKAGQSGFRIRTIEEHAKEQPEIMELQGILLSIGGERLIAPPNVTHDIPLLIEGGFVMDYPVTERIMQPNMCHLNSVELFATGAATGFQATKEVVVILQGFPRVLCNGNKEAARHRPVRVRITLARRSKSRTNFTQFRNELAG